MPGPAPRFVQDRRGGVSIIVAASSLIVVGFAAAAVDFGSVFLKSRELQGVADMAALAAARDIDNGHAAAQATADLKGWNGGIVAQTTVGTFNASPATAVDSRFSAGGSPANAARVKVSAQTDLYFSALFLGKSTMALSRSATAARAELASFSIGSRLMALQGGVANGLLSGLTGSNVNLSVMDYNALASANVDLLGYSQALRTRANLQTATFDDALAGNVAAGAAITSVVDVLNQTGQTAAATALAKVATASASAPAVSVGKLVDLGPYGAQDHLPSAGTGGGSVVVSALDLTQAILMISQGGRQLKLDLGVSAPGLVDLDVWLAVGERPANSPWIAVAQNGNDIVVRTAQARLYVEAKTTSALAGLGVQPITLPILLEVAPAEAKLATINCSVNASSQSAALSVRTGVGEAAIAKIDRTKLDNFNQSLTQSPATLVDVQVLLLKAKVTGKAKVALGGQSWQTVNFTRADITSGVVKTVSTGDLAQSVTASLLEDLDLTVTVAGLGLNVGAVTAPVTAALAQIAPPLDGVLNGLTDLLGVKLGQADVRMNGLRCRDAALVS